jgi:hypothetical protein
MANPSNAPVGGSAPFDPSGYSESLDLVSYAPVGAGAAAQNATIRISPSVFIGAGVAGVGATTQGPLVTPRLMNPVVWGTPLKVPALVTVP